MFSVFNFLAEQTNGIWPWLKTQNESDFGVFLRLGDLEIRWYAICILLGAILALYRCKFELKKKGLPSDYYDNFFMSVIPISLVGARLWYVISQPDQFDSFLDIIGYSNGTFNLAGLAVQGGVLFGLIWGVIYFKFIKKRYPLALHIDLIVPSIFIGQVLGRWGNFFNGEVFGKLVDRKTLWYIPSFIINNATNGNTDPMISNGQALANIGNQAGCQMVNIPLFYVEGALNLIGFILIGIIAWKFWKKFRKPYQIGSLYFIYYGIVRLCLEPLRVNEFIMTREIFGFEVPTSILMSIIFIVLGVAAFVASAIIYRKLPYEKIYVNEAAEALEQKQKEEKEADLMQKIEAKKAEIRARKAKEKEENINE